MSLNPKCPKCGSKQVIVTDINSKHGFFWFILFGWAWLMWWMFKAMLALTVLMCWDWWYAILKKSDGKGYIWLSKRIIQNKSKMFHCEKCGHNFAG